VQSDLTPGDSKPDSGRLTSQVFWFSHREKIYVYASLRQLLIHVDDQTLRQLKQLALGEPVRLEPSILEFVEASQLLQDVTEPPEAASLSDPQPTTLVLCMTNECNLRCLYCYASAGDNPSRVMELTTAINAIHAIARNAQNEGKSEVAINFHGGGEPTLPWSRLQLIVANAQSILSTYGLRLHLGITTNGVFSEEQAGWIAARFHAATISVDGLGAFHDVQRPLACGDGSFDCVRRSVERLDRGGLSLGLRCTVTPRNLPGLEPLFDFAAALKNCRNLQLEPAFAVGRCKSSPAFAQLGVAEFCENFWRLVQKAEQAGGVRVSCSMLRPGIVTSMFCQAERGMMCVAPTGVLSSCLEVTEDGDSRSKLLFVGRLEAANPSLPYWPRSLARLSEVRQRARARCEACFCRFHCAGGCLAKRLTQSFGTSPLNDQRCLMTRQLTKLALVSKLNHPGEQWRPQVSFDGC
jgi:uncharacterized protein